MPDEKSASFLALATELDETTAVLQSERENYEGLRLRFEELQESRRYINE